MLSPGTIIASWLLLAEGPLTPEYRAISAVWIVTE
jgi:hypothetical protein